MNYLMKTAIIIGDLCLRNRGIVILVLEKVDIFNNFSALNQEYYLAF